MKCGKEDEAQENASPLATQIKLVNEGCSVRYLNLLIENKKILMLTIKINLIC